MKTILLATLVLVGAVSCSPKKTAFEPYEDRIASAWEQFDDVASK